MIVLRNRIYYEDKAVQTRKIKGAAIVVANHNALMDFAVMMYAFPMRTLRCIVAEILYRKSLVLKWFMKMLGTIEVDRKGYDFAFVEKCKKNH